MKYIMPVNMAICFHRLRSTVIRCVFNQRMLRTQGLKARVLTKPVRFCSFRGSGLQVSRHCLQSVVNHFLTVLLSDVADCNPWAGLSSRLPEIERTVAFRKTKFARTFCIG